MGVIIERINEFSEKLLSDTYWLSSLAAINFIGFFYGIYYYSYQLSITPAYFWIFTIDSPLPVLLFAAICALLFFQQLKQGFNFERLENRNSKHSDFHDLRKTPPQWLILFAFFGLIKYGAWTDIVIYLFRDIFFAIAPVTYALNFPLHFGMILEGLLLIRLLKPKISDIIFVGGFYLVNDYLDYFIGTVTMIPQGHHTFLMIESFAMTLLLIGIAIRCAKRKIQKRQVVNCSNQIPLFFSFPLITISAWKSW